MKSDRVRYFIITALVIIADQLSKYWVAGTLQGGRDLTIVKGLLNFDYTENRGIAFGMLNNGDVKWVLVMVSFAAIGVVIFYLMRSASPSRTLYIALAFLAGGISGNLIDRLTLGKVIDFIEIYYGKYHWPVFNVADSAISIGAALLALDLFLSPRADHSNQRPPIPAPADGPGYSEEPPTAG